MLELDRFDLGDKPVGTVIEERRYDVKHGVTEATDVQDTIAVRSLGLPPIEACPMLGPERFLAAPLAAGYLDNHD